MRHELTSQEIIRAGRAHETYAKWVRAREFTMALYGPSATSMTYSQTTFPEDDHRLRTTQLLVFDADGHLTPYDFAAPWWAGRDVPQGVLASAQNVAQEDLAGGLGSGFSEAIRDELRAFAEEQLGVETLHTWLGWNESETLTWMFDLTRPPSMPYAKIADEAGMLLSGQDIIVAGRERDTLARWSGARQYVYTLYGERAVKANVIAFSRYNDNTYDRDIRLTVFDAAGVRLFYDLRLPWWERFGLSEEEIAWYDEEHDPNQAEDTEYDSANSFDREDQVYIEIERLATLLLGAEFIDTRNPWDTDTFSYDLTHAPEQHFPQLWTQDGDA
ncbi:MAG TPA: hypothetical protein VGP82_08280 [Ktedonobacterales bacterium]|jgi:hypothetical protein|nr:hypothetical protein [Ktedonobacterales bacterium]